MTTTTTNTAVAPNSIGTTVQVSTGHVAKNTGARYALAIARIMLGWIHLWAFLDKLFGLGKYTPSGQAWIKGGSPWGLFMSTKSDGPFLGAFRAAGGMVLADTLFMVGIGVVAISLTLGIGLRIGAVVGAILLVTLETASLWPDGDLLVTQHWINVAMLFVFATTAAGDTLGLGRRTRNIPWLR